MWGQSNRPRQRHGGGRHLRRRPAALSAHAGNTPFDPRNTLWFWWHVRTMDHKVFLDTMWALVFTVGLMPVLLLSPSAARWVRRERAATILLAGGMIVVLSAPFTGSDLSRLAYPGGT